MSGDCLVRNNVTISGNDPSGQTIYFANGLGIDQSVWRPVADAPAQLQAVRVRGASGHNLRQVDVDRKSTRLNSSHT